MTALDMMTRLRSRYEQHKDLSEMLEIRRAMVTNVTAGYGERQGGSGAKDRMAEHAARVDDLLGRIDRLKRAWALEMELCARLCEKLDSAERGVLFKYYGKNWSIPAIAKDAGYSESYLRQVKRGLEKWLAGISYEQCHMSAEYEILTDGETKR